MVLLPFGPVVLASVLVIGCADTRLDADRGEPQSGQAKPTAAQVPKPSQPPPELTPEDAKEIPPYPPADVKVAPTGVAARITWEPSVLENVIAYRVYRKSGSTKFVKIGESKIAEFIDKAAKRGAVYTVTAVNGYGAESPLAKPSASFLPRPQ